MARTTKKTEAKAPVETSTGTDAKAPMPEITKDGTATITPDAALSATNDAATAPANLDEELPDLFDQAVGFVLRERIEGGYVNDARDPGGETNFGISKRAHPGVNIRDLTRDQAIAIYREKYWDANSCDELPAKVAVAMFDAAVNQGSGAAAKLLQKAVGVATDGKIGPVTRAAVARTDEDELLIQFLGWRLRRYAFTANAATYMRGWSNRVLYLQRFVNTELRVA